jgi:hypothetical protein
VAERYTITGADEVARTMRKAGRSLGDMTHAHRDAADIFASLARATAPRVSGALANATQAAATKDGAGIQNALPYFGPIHYGWPQRNIAAQPYVDEAVADSESQWLAVYQKAAQDAADSVKGA